MGCRSQESMTKYLGITFDTLPYSDYKKAFMLLRHRLGGISSNGCTVNADIGLTVVDYGLGPHLIQNPHR